ncbi:hypothetical protein FGSG_08838 [Fusarium graminearum PH-1]|uniref:Chromosome 2, complete genome n=1 Tax=Gibberella zeae (strain ATCC MYA-4620 / CBS 123657 / FGSC 9075 / NRRL 31084 / PH-1) TaxID=229533 RepID=I1RWZ8_GIBZE|nr:hypothetical protein FGSG_08838 [Fusarium graminearum PH-1]ESU14450.1 hypothetical protein FGSG_08838 [Fusarium graminearum PH-1]CEF77282.1 unnamed protein product [Fusarium graminearum]|eukprot:XP_011319875.1 hypothetical protein FGSG_08838 [Fusarium graminearum PH-1]
MSSSSEVSSVDSSEWELVERHPKLGVCCSIKFYDGVEGEVNIPEFLIQRHPYFAALFSEDKYLDCSPVPRDTAHVVALYLVRGCLPGPIRGEPEKDAARRLFKKLIIYCEDACKFNMPGLEEMACERILKLLRCLDVFDIVEITTKEREWRLAKTDDMLIRILDLRICEDKETVPDTALALIDEFCETVSDVKWHTLKALMRTTANLQLSKRAVKALTDEKFSST